MDLVRERPRRLPRTVIPVVAIVALVALAAASVLWLRQAQAAPPTVDRATVATSIARRGALLLTVLATGVFVPERIRVISTPQTGVVDEIFVKIGTTVRPGTAVARIQNPAIAAAVLAALSALAIAEANLESARQQARAAVIGSQAAIADADAIHAQDRIQLRTDKTLAGEGILAPVVFEKSQIQEVKSRNDLLKSQAQLGLTTADGIAKIAAAQAQADGARAQLASARAQVAALSVRASSAGVVQSIDVDPGASVASNAQIARIADMHDLKAVLQVAESDLSAIAIGMPTRITDGSGAATGHIARIAPSAHAGTIAVDVTFGGAPPPGALPAANLDAIIQVARLPDALSIARPAGASDGDHATLFRLIDASRAIRTRVTLGRGANERMVVTSGLAAGDTVIISDMSPYLNAPEIRLR